MYKYEYSNQRRVNCPFCGKEGKFSVCVNTETGEFTEDIYGMCSSCGEHKLPPDNYINDGVSFKENESIGYFDADTIDPELWLKTLKEMHYKDQFRYNNFIEGLEKIFGVLEVEKMIDLYRLGRFYNGGIVFPYFYTDDHLTTGKIMWYDDNFHRIHKKTPMWLHNMKHYYEEKWYDRENDYYKGGYHHDFVTEDEYYGRNQIQYNLDGNDIIIEEIETKFNLKMSLFGHNLILNDKSKIICLVESEKTACIMSIVLPEFIWVASGSATYIQDYKFMFFANRKCYAFADMSENDKTYLYWKKKLDGYNDKNNCDFQLIDYYTDFVNKHYKEFSENTTPEDLLIAYKEKGYDLADFVLGYNNNNRYIKFFKKLLENINQTPNNKPIQ